MSDTTETIPVEEARRQVKLLERRIAMMYIAFARLLVDELGEERGKELIQKAVRRHGEDIGGVTRKRAEAAGAPLTLENFRKYNDIPTLMHKETAGLEIDGYPAVRTFECGLGVYWREIGETELGRLYCHVDQAKAQGYSPGIEHVHATNMLDRDDLNYCDHIIRDKKI